MLLVAVWVDPDAHDETRGAPGEPRRDAARRSPTPSRPTGRRASRSWSTCATARATPSTAATDGAHRRGRDPPLPLSRSIRRSPRPGIPSRAGAGGDARHRPHRRRRRRLRQRRRRCPTRRCSSACCAGVDPMPHARSCARCARRSTSTAAGRGRSRSRCGIWSGARWASRCGGCSAAGTSGSLAYASTGELVDAGRARRAGAARCASAGVRAIKLRFHHDDWRARRRGRWRRCATRSAPTSRSWSTPTRAGGCPAT